MSTNIYKFVVSILCFSGDRKAGTFMRKAVDFALS